MSGDELLFKLTGRSDGYVAVGLSPDNDKMGDDLTTACYYDSNSNEVNDLLFSRRNLSFVYLFLSVNVVM